MNPPLVWFLVGLVLLLLEFAIPGIVLVFFGVGAWFVAAGAALGWVPDLTLQLLLFIAASLTLLFLLRGLVRKWFIGDTQINDAQLEEFIGKSVEVLSDIPGGTSTGKVMLKGAQWRARSEHPISAGSRAVIQSRDGLVLLVGAESA